MKRITIWLLITFLTFFIGITAAFIYIQFNSYNNQNSEIPANFITLKSENDVTKILPQSEPIEYFRYTFKQTDGTNIIATVLSDLNSPDPQARIIRFDPAFESSDRNSSIASQAYLAEVSKIKKQILHDMSATEYNDEKDERVSCWLIKGRFKQFCLKESINPETKAVYLFHVSLQ